MDLIIILLIILVRFIDKFINHPRTIHHVNRLIPNLLIPILLIVTFVYTLCSETTAQTPINTSSIPEIIRSDKPSLLISLNFTKNPLIAGSKQSIIVGVSDTKSGQPLDGVLINGNVTYPSGLVSKLEQDTTGDNGRLSYSWILDKDAKAGNYRVSIGAFANGFQNESELSEFKLLPYFSFFTIGLSNIELMRVPSHSQAIPMILHYSISDNSEETVKVSKFQYRLFADNIPLGIWSYEFTPYQSRPEISPGNTHKFLSDFTLSPSMAGDDLFKELVIDPTRARFIEWKVNGTCTNANSV